MEQFKRVELIPGKFEDIESGRSFDIAVLHNVTEHLIRIDEVIEGIASKLRPGGRILFNHHNFYCWNGHHQFPKTTDQIDLNDPEQKKYMDWAHIRFTPPEGHYFRRGLNKIKLDELRDIVERRYEIEVWNEIPSSEKNGGLRLTDNIVARFPELTRRDLAIHNVFCVATKNKAAKIGRSSHN
jgi:SAM-dependent methyltransferase